MDSGEENPFQLFSSKRRPPKQPSSSYSSITTITATPAATTGTTTTVSDSDSDTPSDFSSLGLSEWSVETCRALGMHRPTQVQRRCIPQILAGRDVLGLAETGSGKTAAFALPILQSLATDMFGVFALVVTPTRELAVQLVEQFRALGSSINVRCELVVGGMDMTMQAIALLRKPHVVVATPGRIKTLLEDEADIPAIFSKTKFLVLDEADRVFDVDFEEELRVIFKCLPNKRQTLLFSATMTSELQALHDSSPNKPYFYRAYKHLKTVDTLKQHYLYFPDTVKDVYLVHILANMEQDGIRSAIVFVSTCRTCHRLSLLLEELGMPAVALHSLKSQSLRLSALSRFKSGQVPILLATDVASRGLDIPTVDLVLNYDIPRDSRDYVHRVGRTARAGRGGLSLIFVTEKDVKLYLKIEDEIQRKLEEFKLEEKEVLENMTSVYKARRVAHMKMIDDGFEEKVEARKAQKKRTLEEKGLLK